MIIGIVIMGVLIVFTIITYNKLVTLRHRTFKIWSDISTHLRLRYDLVPGLLNSLKTYMIHEQKTLEGVIKARTAFQNATTVEETAKAENMFTGALKSLFAVSESYPELKASGLIEKFQDDIANIENKLRYARQAYNNAVNDYNVAITLFPANIIAGVFSFKEQELFKIEEEVEKAPEYNFN